MKPTLLKALKKLQSKIYKSGVDGGETTGEYISKLEDLIASTDSTEYQHYNWFRDMEPNWSCVYNWLCEFEQSVDKFMSALLEIQRKCGNMQESATLEAISNSGWWYSTRRSCAYQDDGNTRTDGTSISAVFIVPFEQPITIAGEARPVRHDIAIRESYGCWYHGYIADAIVFSCGFDIRNSDMKCYSPSFTLDVAPHQRKEKSNIRICHDFGSANNFTPPNFVKSDALLSTYLILESSMKERQLRKLIDGIIAMRGNDES